MNTQRSTVPQVWFITGCSRGLGLALAEAVLAAGHRLVATARRPGDLAPLVAAHGERVRALALDVTDERAARAAVDAAVESFGGLDVVVNNAGYANVASIEDLPADDFRAQLETNFFGVVNVTRAALPVLRAQGRGHIIQISSIGGRTASPGLGAYQSAKWAVGGFSEVLAREVRPLGLRVTVVEPGGIRTDWAGASMKVYPPSPAYQASVGAFASQVRAAPEGSRGDPARMAQAILTLAALPEPPLRLLLGTDASFLAGVILAERAAEDARYRELSESTDFAGMGRFADSPVAQLLLAARR